MRLTQAGGLLVLGAVGALGVNAVFSRWFKEERPQQAAAPVERASGDGRELDALRAEVRQLQREVGRVGARQADPDVEAAQEERPVDDREVGGQPPPGPPPTPAQEAAWLMARSKFYDEKLAAEPRDSTWARSVESRAKELYQAKEFEGTDLVNVSCYTKSCRLEFSYADMANRERHLSSLPRDFPDLPRASFAYPGAPADQLRAIVYLSKEKLERFNYDQYTKAE